MRGLTQLTALPRRRLQRVGTLAFLGAMLSLISLLAAAGKGDSPQAAAQAASPSPDKVAALLEGFRHVEVASVSDALEQLTGKKMYMTHRMRPIFTTRFAGR